MMLGVSTLMASNLNPANTIEVLAPTVDFTFNNNNSCSDTPITFNPIVSGDAPYTYVWDFGDGTTSTNSNPTHAFTALGCGIQNFSVKLTVTDRNGLSNSITKTVSVQQKPDLKFVNKDVGLSSVFERCGDNNSSLSYTINVGNMSTSNACITSYNIDWGDGRTETNVSFPKQHTYTRLGSFNMVITAVGGSGCNNRISYIVKNSNNPVGALIAPGNTTNFCVPLDAPMDFAIGSWALNPSDTRYQISYGDGTAKNFTQSDLESSVYYNAANPTASRNFPIPHTFSRFNCPGGNTVVLTISNSCGSTNLTAGPIIILDKPVVSFSATNIACVNSAVFFSNTTVAGYNNGCSTQNVYTWNFGDGTAVSRDVSPAHVYTRPGNFTVTLDAVTPCGVGQRFTRTICVEPVLQPNFTYVKACVNSNTQITNTTDTSQACGAQSYYWSIVSYYDPYCDNERGNWNFVAGTGSNSKDPVINFTVTGNYSLRLRTINSCGIEREITKTIEVKKPPIITLDPISDFCNSATIRPVGKVIENCAPSSELTYSWSFPGGTPSSSTSLNPGSINYTTSGNYTATFSVTNSCGTVTKAENFSVNTVLSPIIAAKSDKICSGSSFTISPRSGGGDNVPAGTTYTWLTPTISPAGAISGASAQLSPRTNISQTLINNTSNRATVTYTVSPTAGSCPGPNFTVTVIVDPLINPNPLIRNTSCFGANDGTINLTVSGGIPFPTGNPYQFSWTGEGFTNLYKADIITEGSLTAADKFQSEINSKFNESTPVFTKDGKTVYFTRNNYLNGKKGEDSQNTTLLKLYSATLEGKKWTNIKELSFNSNNYSVAHPALSMDEHTLYFASDMPGTLGESDLYKIAINTDGSFGAPINLGNKINTEGRETFPMITSDGELYFASDGHPGLGGLDIFVSKINTNENHSDVINVGEPVNSSYDDFGFLINDKTRYGYFTSNREGGKGSDDIYKFKETKKLVFNCEQNLSGLVVDKQTTLPLPEAKVTLLDSAFNSIKDVISDKEGKFDFGLKDCKDIFYIKVEKQNFATNQTKEIIIKDNEASFVEIPLDKSSKIIEKGNDLMKLYDINIIYFDLSKYNIRPDAEVELAKILDVLEQHPRMKIDIRSHTDSRQSAEKNRILSQNRANSTMAWLVKHGINKNRLTAKGFGESQLLNKCVDGVNCTEEEHQANRRSEFIVIKI